MAPKNEFKKPSKIENPGTSTSNTLAADTVIIGADQKLRVLKLTNVQNKKLVKPESSELDPVYIEPTPFTSEIQSPNNFSLAPYRNFCNVGIAVSYLSRSLEIKEQLQIRNVFIRTSNKDSLTIVKDLNESDVLNVVSFNKACAILSAGVLKHVFKEEFDWTLKKYVPTTGFIKNCTSMKQLLTGWQGFMGMDSKNPYYWMIVPGYEFLYELYPAGVLAYTLIRLEFRKNLNIPDDMTDSDIVNSLVMKMNRIHKLETTPFDDAISLIGRENISEAYVELARDIGTTSKSKRNDEAIGKFKELIKNFAPALAADRGAQ
uniref:Putative nucleocapsid p3 n=1 Tax=Emaravirus rosae TaxID=1980433 RepID=F2YDN9_9VIRU|nr:putative nucleocapsid p3 [Emaravirus rosae]